MNRLLLLVLPLVVFVFAPAFAHPHAIDPMDGHTHDSVIIPLDETRGIERSLISFDAPSDNELPWGFVRGVIPNHVEGYPVIIQIFDGTDPIHFAQTDVNPDGSYEYRFRVLSSDDTSTVRIFDGAYTVKIFKVVYLDLKST